MIEAINHRVFCESCQSSVDAEFASTCDLCGEYACDECIHAHPSADEGVCDACATQESWERPGYLVP